MSSQGGDAPPYSTAGRSGEHSSSEDRFILLGISERLRLLVVCHTYRANENVIRIISARKASNDEREQYFDRWQQ